jgi:membrane protein DedA with SNARE-associated domain/rhodanese-related sulfurtransferase
MPIALVFFVHYAYLIIFLWVLVEQVGIPIPSIPLLLTAGTLTATHRINSIYLLLAVLASCLIADTMWFSLGRRYGNSVLKLLCRLSFEASTCVSKTEGYFTRRGPITLLFSKFVPGLSTVAAPIAGQTGMPYGRFLLWDLGGSILWAETFILAGRFFGDLAKKSGPFFHWLGHFAFFIFILMVLGFLTHRILKQRKFLAKVRELRLEPSELKEMLDVAKEKGNIPPFIVDLRHPLDYLPDPRVLPGALRIGPNELKLHSEILPRDRDVILYCTCPSEETSAKLALQLHKMGVYRVRPLRGGFDGWKEAGYPLVDYVKDVPSDAVVETILPAPATLADTSHVLPAAPASAANASPVLPLLSKRS